MATLTQTCKHYPLCLNIIKKCDEAIEKLIPRRCMVVSAGLFFAGVSIPLLMTIGVLPVNFLFGFIGFALAATGGVLALTLYGEI